MARHSGIGHGKRIIRAIVGSSIVLALLAGCTSSSPIDAGDADGVREDSDGSVPDSADPGAGAHARDDADLPDIPDELGDFHPEGSYVQEQVDYSDEPDPPDSVSVVLCNLNSTYLVTLAEFGMSEAGANMPMAALSLSDDIQVWEGLAGRYPEVREDIEIAQRVHNFWRTGMAYQEIGDQVSMDESYRMAEAEIAELSDVDLSEEVAC